MVDGLGDWIEGRERDKEKIKVLRERIAQLEAAIHRLMKTHDYGHACCCNACTHARAAVAASPPKEERDG